jgi:NAD(P)-dependent dehydrogenase (short-subunit alcohol dehydrogenase family)
MTPRVCLLTGASGALGTAFIERFAPQYRIIAVHHRTPVHFATADQRFVDPLAPSAPVAANTHAVHAIGADLCQAADVDRLVAEVAERFGHVDLVVNGAAIRAWSSLLASGAVENTEQVLRTNVVAPLRVSLTIARRFWEVDPAANERANRNIVNVSSSAGLFVYPDLGQAAYAASKAALNHLTYHLASELWPLGVRVNAIAPDSFPGRVSTSAVLDTIAALDASTQTGEVVQLLGEHG